jgi:hypothetical protein
MSATISLVSTDAPTPSATPSTSDVKPTNDDGKVEKEESLVLDELSNRLQTLKLFQEDDPARADALLEQFGAQGVIESQMLAQLSESAPLLHPDRFEQAHRTAMHALEVFDRNAGRKPSNLKAGLLTPLATIVVQQVIRIIVRGYQSSVINSIKTLYTQRQARSPKGSPEFVMLRIARRDAERLAPALNKKAGGLPAFLVGGAVLSGVTSVLQAALKSVPILLGVAAVYVILALATFWCVLKAAAIARRRTRIALDQPLRALWETIGAAGTPPQDRSRQFGVYAGILLVTVWVVVPAVAAFAVFIARTA